MMNYRNEAAFSKALVTAMRRKGFFVQRIESGETGRGIPDIYCVGPNKMPFWLELKRVHSNAGTATEVFIPWRPGQQAWLTEVSAYGQAAHTIACFNDGILDIPMTQIYTGNKVLPEFFGIRFYKSINEFLGGKK